MPVLPLLGVGVHSRLPAMLSSPCLFDQRTLADRSEEEEEEDTVNEPTQEEEFARRIEDAAVDDVDDEEDEGMHSPPIAAVITDDVSWFSEMSVDDDVNGPVKPIDWKFCGTDGEYWQDGDDIDLKRPLIDYFMTCFPPLAMRLIVTETNKKLVEKRADVLDVGEFIKFVGVMILITRFEFGDRRECFPSKQMSPFMPAPNISATTGMSRHRFDIIWSCITFSRVPPVRPEAMTSAEYRWKHIDDFVEGFNLHRRKCFIPSERICIDESMSRWYGNGGDWINEGLPHYIAMDRKVCLSVVILSLSHPFLSYYLHKPENGCEIQNAACGKTGIMMELLVVKGEATEKLDVDDDDKKLLHGTQVMLSLLKGWRSAKTRIVCADSYFASVGAAKRLYEYGFRFIGVVKTATKGFPIKFLGSVMMPERGTVVPLTAMNDEVQLLSFVYCDRDRRYFIATCSNAGSGEPILRRRLHQVLPVHTQAAPENVTITMNQPKAAEIYYSCCGMIDRHNRARQDTLNLEKKIQTKVWHKRVNTSVLGMIIVDTFLLYQGCTHSTMTQPMFYRELIGALIDNRYLKGRASRLSIESGSSLGSSVASSTTGSAGRGLHLTPSKRRADDNDDAKLRRFQHHCKYCRLKTTSLCSECRLNPEYGDKQAAFCHPSTGRYCYQAHMTDSH